MASMPISTTGLPSTTHLTPLKSTLLHTIRKPHKTHQESYFKHISCLCKDGRLDQSMDLLIEMESKNLPIGPQIYGELLQGCVYERNLSLGQQFHAKIIKNGEFVAKNEYIETKLVIFYAKFDLLEVGTSLFCRLRERNVFSWAAIIGLYCRKGFNEEALLGYCEMQEYGFLADNFVIPNSLKACGALQLPNFGKGVHGYVFKMGYDGCVFVGSSLVDMYGKCGLLEDARKVFDKMAGRNVITWNSMITSYVQNGMDEEGIGMLYDMRMEGIEPTRVTLVSFLSASANLCAVEEAKQGHALAILSGLDLDNILGTSILNCYSSVGLVRDAEFVFCRMVEKDVVTWNLLISCYVQHRQVENALNLCCLMRLESFRYDPVTLASIVSAAADSKNVKLGKEAHCYCIRNDFVSDVVVTSSIVDMYGKCQKVYDARQVFDFTVQRDLVLWNTLLAAYSELGLSGETLKLFYQMQLEGVLPNVVSWNSVILGFLRNGQVNEAIDMFSEMQSLGIQPNLVSHTTLITGLAQNGLGNLAIMLFQQILEAGIQPNTVSFVGVLSACKDTASLHYGRATHGYIMRHGIHLSGALATSLVDMYAKCGDLDKAKMVFDGILMKELPLYNAMISSYALHGCTQEAFSLFKHLLKEDIKPDSITFTNVLSSCRHAGLMKEGLDIFADMISKHHVEPSIEHYGCVVSLLSRCANLHEVIQLIKSMPVEPDAHILGSLLASCREHNEIELGKYLAEILSKMEPDNSGNCVALSNAYAATGRWDETWQLRSSMKEKGMRKSPGCSWIQTGSEVHVFVAGDVYHSQTDEIQATLALLRMEMQLVGYAPIVNKAETQFNW